MILDRFTNKEAYRERKINHAIAMQADAAAEFLAANNNEVQFFNAGRCPEHLSVEEFAARVGQAAIDKFSTYSTLEAPTYNDKNTVLANSYNPAIGTERLGTVPPPAADVRVAFNRTAPERVLHLV